MIFTRAVIAFLIVIFVSCDLSAKGKKRYRKAQNIHSQYEQALAKESHDSHHDIPILAKQAVIMDMDSSDVLLEKEADTLIHPASMTKLMSAYVVMKKIKEGKITLLTPIVIPKNAHGVEGTTMFLEAGKSFTVEDLLKGLLIISGNDAAIALAEGICGSVSVFCEEMTKAAHDMGAVHTVFKNPNGLPEEGHVTTARELVKIVAQIAKEYPKIKKWSCEKEFLRQHNKNRFLWRDVGCTGGKTGHAKICGYGIVAFFEDPRFSSRTIMFIHGLASEDYRLKEGLRLLEWTRNHFETKKVFDTHSVLTKIPLYYAAEKEVIAIPKTSTFITFLKGKEKEIKMSFSVPDYLGAPLEKGQIIGRVCIEYPSLNKTSKKELDVVTKNAAKEAHFLKRMLDHVALYFKKKRAA